MGTRIAILASGEGTNAKALLDASANGALGGGEVVVVVSDRREAAVLDRGDQAGVETVFVDPEPFSTRAGYGDELVRVLQGHNISLVCLAGFMRILPPNFIKAFPDQIINIHPSLLPAFPGAHPVRDAIEWGVRVTGATVHFADEKVDAGPIILQQAVQVLPDDDEEALHARVKEVEHHLYVDAVWLFCSQKLHIDGRIVRVDDSEAPPSKLKEPR